MPLTSRRWRTALTAAMLGSAAFAGDVDARVVSAVAPEHNVTVFHSIDFVAVFGDSPGTTTTVEALRNGQLIGAATGPAVDVGEFVAPNNGGLEVNHGPVGAPQPGDCWEGFTPDIIPGDLVRVTRGTAVEEVEIDNITIDEGPFVDGAGNVVLRGTAAMFDGTPWPIADLDSGEVRNTSAFRGAPTSIVRTPGTTDGWTATYDPNRPLEREREILSPSQRRDTIMSGDHAMGKGHVAPLPRETLLFAGGETPGPALGCEASASESNAVLTADDTAVNVASGDLAVTGSAMAATVDNDITQVIPKVTDGTKTITAAPIDVTGAVRTWSATFARAELATLADAKLTVTADYVTADGPIGGKVLELNKDVVAPDVAADLASGEYTGPVAVTLAGAPGDKITYRTDGLPNGASDRAYTGPIALPFGPTTIAARVTDAAGNTTDKQFSYTVNRPVAPAVRPVVIPPVIVSTPQRVLRASTLKATRRMKARTARRTGLRVSFLAPGGAKVAQVRLYRLVGARRVLVSTRTLAVKGGRRHAVRLRIPRSGLYLTEIRVGALRTALGPASTIRTRIIR